MFSGTWTVVDDVIFEFYNGIRSSVMLRIISTVLLATWMYWLWSRRKFYMLSTKLPGPLAFPIIGNALDIGAFGNGKDVPQNIMNLGLKYPSPFRLWEGLKLLVILYEADDLEIYLMSKASATKDKRYDMVQKLIGHGLFSGSGPKWKKHRHIINPSFNLAALRSYLPVYNKHARNLVEGLANICDKGLVEPVQYCKRCVADNLIEALFGEQMEYYKGDKDYMIDLTTDITERLQDRMTKFWQELDLIYNLTNQGKLQREQLKVYKSIFHSRIKQRINEYIEDKKAKENVESVENLSDGLESKRIKTSLQTLVDAYLDGEITEAEIYDEFDNLYNPGVETTFSNLGFFMLMMGMHKKVQTKLWKEIHEFYGDSKDSVVLHEHFKSLPYLNMCLKELIRLFPTGPIVTRKLLEDFELKHKNITIPAGSNVLMSVYILHRNPKYWSSPNSFIPERFSPEESKKRPHFAYIPFLAGSRNCIGQHLAMDLLKTTTIYLIRNYEFHSDMKMHQLKLIADMSTRSATGYKVCIAKRKYD